MKKENIFIILIIIFAILIKIYFLTITYNQSLWWDEAEYMLIINNFAFNTDYETLVRPIFFSWMISPIYNIFPTELVPRIMILIFSVALIYGIYLCGKTIFNQEVGLISAFLVTIFSFINFISTKIMVDIPSFTLYTFAAYFFYLYLTKENKKNIYISSILIGLGSLLRITTLLFFIIIIISLFYKQKFKIIKNKELWISSIITSLIIMPYILWGYIKYNKFIITAATDQVVNNNILTAFPNMMNYLIFLFKSLLYIDITNYSVLFFILIIIFFVPLPFIKNEKRLYVYLLIIVPFIVISFFINHVENRYIINSFLGISILCGYILMKIKKINIIIMIIILLIMTFLQFNTVYNNINEGLNDFDTIRETGYWMKEYSAYNFISSNPYQMTYYSKIKVLPIPRTINDLNNVTYIIIKEDETDFIPKWIFEELKYYSLEKKIDDVFIYKRI